MVGLGHPSATVEPPPAEAIDAGVIADARTRQRRQRGVTVAGVLLAVLVGLVAYVAYAGGASAKHAPPSPRAAAGSLRALARSAYQFWVTPTLDAGYVSLDLRVAFTDGTGGETNCRCDDYQGRVPVVGPGLPGFVIAPIPRNFFGQNQVLFVPANVAAVRVGSLGSVATQTANGLPPGEKVVAFQVPNSAAVLKPHPRLRVRLHRAQLTLRDAGGHALPFGNAPFRPERTTASGGACAVTSTLAGLSDQAPSSVVAVKPLSASLPGVFLSCLDDGFTLNGTRLQVAVLLNAHHPNQPPAPLWGSSPLPGHHGVIEIRPPSRFTFNVDTGAPWLARRVGNAWIVVAGRPGLPPAPTTAQRLQVLDSIHIAHIDLSHT